MSSIRATLRPEDLLEHLEWMHRLARSLTGGDAAEAEDLTGDALQAALADAPQLRGPVRPWLGGVLRNLARMRARSGARRRRRHAAALVDGEMAPSPRELAERAEAQRLVTDLVLGLEEPFRSTLLLRYYEGMSGAEIARRQGVPAGTVRWRIKHALDELRPALDRAYGGRREKWHALLLPLPMSASGGAASPASDPHPETRPGAASGTSLAARAIVAARSVPLLVTLLVPLLVTLLAGVAGLVALAHRARPAASPLARVAAGQPTGGAAHVGPRGALPFPGETPDPDGGLRIEGQVIDQQENPLGGALVAIDSRPPRTVVTRPDGGFVLTGLMPRAYRLEATSGDLYAGIAETYLSPSSEPTVLRAGKGAQPRVVVRAASDGQPIAGAQVTLRSILSWEGRTGPDGAVAFTGLPRGWPQVRVEAAGYATFRGTMAPDEENAWEVRLEPGTLVAGRVVDAHGAAVGGALVWAAPTSELSPTDDPRRDAVTTDADGRWSMAGLVAGTYRFGAAHPDHAQGETAPTTIDASRPGSPVDIRLEDGGTLTGEVRASDGRPLALVQVLAAGKLTIGSRFPREGFTDTDGRFRLRGLPRRVIDVVAVGSDASSAIVAVDLQASAREQHVVLVMTNDQLIAGTVVDRTGQPVAEAQVIAEPAPWSWTPGAAELRGKPRFISDGGGHFRLAGLPAGDYRLRASPAVGSDFLAPFEGVPARPGDLNVRIVIPGRGSVRGTVSYEDGDAPPRFGVTMGTMTREFSAADGGAFTITVPAGVADLVVSGKSFSMARVPGVEVVEGKTTEVGVVTVKRGRSVSGRVLRADGTPVAGADVTAGAFLMGDGRKVRLAPGIPAVETRSSDDGRYAMTLADTDLVMVADRPGVGRSPVVSISRDVSRDVDLVIGATSTLNGLVSRAGQPLPYAPVIATPRGNPTAQFLVTSGPDGHFQFEVLAPGPYRVRVMEGAATLSPRGIFSDSVSVEEGRPARLDVDIPSGPYTLTVDVRTEQGDAVPGATVLVAKGAGGGEASSVKELYDRLAASPDGPLSLYTASEPRAGSSISIADLVPGLYTICATPSAISLGAPSAEPTLGRCVVQQVDSSRNVSLAIPAGWVRP